MKGAPIVGRALEPPFSHPYEVPAAISVAELLATAKKRRQAVIQRVKFMVRKVGRPKLLPFISIYAKTLKEVAQGSMAGPFTDKVLVQQFGEFYDVTSSPALGFTRVMTRRATQNTGGSMITRQAIPT